MTRPFRKITFRRKTIKTRYCNRSFETNPPMVDIWVDFILYLNSRFRLIFLVRIVI